MRNLKLTILGSALCLVCAGTLRARYEEAPEPGSRPLGMGGAFVALADDANGVYWNPAGLMQMKRQDAILMEGAYSSVTGGHFDYLAYVYPMPNAVVGVGWSTVDLSEDMYYLSLGLNPAFFGKDTLTVGATLKRLTIDTRFEDGSGLGFDFGAMFRPVHWAQFGIMVRNVATDVRNEKLPTTFRVGLASRLLTDRMRLAFDVSTKQNVGSVDTLVAKTHVGIELQPEKRFAVRAGLDDGFLAVGVGIDIASIKLDYGYQSYSPLGAVHRLSIGVDFGPDVTRSGSH